MKEFMGAEFLLKNKTAVDLFNSVKNEPIFDYSSSLSAKEVANNKHFSNLTEVWISGDTYKYRALRAFGIDEYYITGDANDYEKFLKWAEVVPYLLGNPIYHFSHLELQRFFGIYEPLSPLTAESVWNRANEIIVKSDFSVLNILKKMNVRALCTKDDPTDSLKYHIELAGNSSCDTIVLPTFCADKAVKVSKDGWIDYIKKLETVTIKPIISYNDLINALEDRLLFFRSVGSRIAEHTVSDPCFIYAKKEEIDGIFKKALKGDSLTKEENIKYKTRILADLGKLYSKNGFVMSLVLNTIKDNNTKMASYFGEHSGFDSINDGRIANMLSGLLNVISEEDLPKTVISSENESDYYVLGSMLGNFCGGEKGKIQFGCSSMFSYNKDGIKNHIKALSNLGILPLFIGPATNGGSFLSYSRHEYFRRILCNVIGKWVENGEYPNYDKLLKKIVSDISYKNIKDYLGI